MTKTISSQINKSEWKEAKWAIAQHFVFLENKFMEAYSSSSKTYFVYCTNTTSFSFNFDWLYPMTHVSSGDKKGVIFFLRFASSFMWCGQLFSGRTLYSHNF